MIEGQNIINHPSKSKKNRLLSLRISLSILEQE